MKVDPPAGQTRGRIGAGFLYNPAHLLALGFGIGYAPIAPGTAGTLLGVAIYHVVRPAPLGLYLLAVVVLTVVAVRVCQQTAADLGAHDHPAIVLDEVLGYLVAMVGAPSGWGWVALGFILFRTFDIAKPWPIGAVDARIGGGLGIVLDDLLAGLYAWMLLQLTVNLLA